MVCALSAPVARTPLTCSRSVFSIASAYNLVSTPISFTAMARMPAKGPRPTTLTKKIAQTRLSIPRTTSLERRTRKRTGPKGMIFRAPIMARGMAITDATSVPRNAIAKVSPMAPMYSHTCSVIAGGIISMKTLPSCPMPSIKRPGVTSKAWRPQRKSPRPRRIATARRHNARPRGGKASGHRSRQLLR